MILYSTAAHPAAARLRPEGTKGLFSAGRLIAAACLIAALWSPSAVRALEPEELLLIANTRVPEGIELARHYMKRRGIPAQHLLTVSVTDQETCSAREYRERIAAPLRAHPRMAGKTDEIRCLVLLYGMPLRIRPDGTDLEQHPEMIRLKQRQAEITARMKAESHQEAKTGSGDLLKTIANEINRFRQRQDRRASLDSEIALVRKRIYPLAGWIRNPYYVGFQQEKLVATKSEVLMVSRLDGPDPAAVRRIIDDSIMAERGGLSGRAYFDARWSLSSGSRDSGYALYDRSIHQAAAHLKTLDLMPVVLDEQEALFQPKDAPDAALYCGWYSLTRYVDAFVWRPGAVGYHIASGECTTLKRPDSQAWCKRMIESGVAATLGPVSEPYIGAFPLPEIFFRFLTDGYLSLAECYQVSLPFLSWKMVLIGDPLYRPFSPAD